MRFSSCLFTQGLLQNLLQGNRIIVLGVMRTVNQGEAAAPGRQQSRPPRPGDRLEFFEIAAENSGHLAGCWENYFLLEAINHIVTR
jgi:hypothetical protein